MSFRFRLRFGWTLGVLLLAGFVSRLVYVALQARTDPWFSHPIGDPAATLDWAAQLAAGGPGPAGAFYGAPLYPYLLAGYLKIFGAHAATPVNFGLLYYLQHLMVLGTAALFAVVGRRVAGETAGLAACALYLLYGPSLFFASRPMSEPLTMLLVSGGLAVMVCVTSTASAAATGALAGLAALGRPSLLPLAPAWCLGLVRRRPWAAALLAAVFGLCLLPATWHNYRESGHLVPVAANAGLTFYHGNWACPESAESCPEPTGYYSVPNELLAGKGDQREKATRLASRETGRALDDVEADRYWGGRALRERLADPLGTLHRLALRASLLLCNAELALDMGPRQDANPLRRLAPLPFAAIVGLAAAGVGLRGFRRTGGWAVWGAILTCVLTPLVFYVSSRYRFPFAALLCLPAGMGLASLVRPAAEDRSRRVGGLLLVIFVSASLLATIPAADAIGQSDAGGLVQRGLAWMLQAEDDPQGAGHLVERAERDVRASIEADPDGGSAYAHYLLGQIEARTGRVAEAERSYRRAMEIRDGYAPAACGLGELLRVEGKHEEAIPVLQRGIANDALEAHCWNHLIGALVVLERLDDAENVARQGAGLGVALDARLMGELRRLRAAKDAGQTPAHEEGGGEGD